MTGNHERPSAGPRSGTLHSGPAGPGSGPAGSRPAGSADGFGAPGDARVAYDDRPAKADYADQSAAPAASTTPTGPAAPAGRGALAAFERWDRAEDFARGRAQGAAWSDGALRPAGAAAGREEYADPFGHGCASWEYGRWTSPWVPLPFTATDVVPSWTADAPDGARLTVRLQVRDPAGAVSPWYVLAHWCAGDALVHRATVPGQGDAHGRVDVDTFTAGPAGIAAYRLAVDLAAAVGGGAAVALTGLYAAASRAAAPHERAEGRTDGRADKRADTPADGRAVPPAGTRTDADRRTAQAVPAADTRAARGVVLDVPGRSQGAHTGHCPQWDGGGEAWAGPACTAMLVEFFGRGPDAADLAWLDPEDPAPQVDFAARQVYDHAYRGCGNWAFNAAYPARYGLRGMVVRLLSLADLERFVAAGVPVATSLALRSTELSGPGRSYTTAGNIVVVCGFTAAGDVVVNDPLAAADDEVRRVYPRAAFARVWLSGSAAGAAYLVHPPDLTLPPHPGDGPPRW